MNIIIQPKEILLQIASIKIDIIHIILNDLAIIKVSCFDLNSNYITSYDFELLQPDYNIWQKDEDLINYVCDKYGFTLVQDEL